MKNNHPEMRFSGFEEPWKENKVGEFLRESSIPGSNGLSAKKLTVKLWGKGVVAKQESHQGSEATKYYIRKSDQFIYGKLDFLNQAFGIIPKELDGYESTVDSPAFDILDSIDPKFLLEYVSRKQFYLFQGTIANGSRKAKRIHSETFFKMPIILPDLTEQKFIGDFFRQIDNTITMREQELDTLKQTKQGFLQKMFPKEGETAPEIRLPGFDEEWKVSELKNVATFINGRAYKQDELLKSGKYKVLRVGNFYTNTSWYYSDLELGDKYYANKGDLLYTWSASFGPHIWNGDKVIYHYHIWKVELKNNCDKQFIVQLLEYDKAKIISDKNGSTMVHITKRGMEEKVVLLPKIEEQIKIGEFFKQLDKTIELHEKELEALKETKKAFLQKMFV